MIIEMTATALIYYGATSTHATSDAARHVADQIETGRRHLQNSVSFGLGEKSVLNELCAVAEECKSSNWDSQGAASVADDTYRVAYRFWEAMPLGTAGSFVGGGTEGHKKLGRGCAPPRPFFVWGRSDRGLVYSRSG